MCVGVRYCVSGIAKPKVEGRRSKRVVNVRLALAAVGGLLSAAGAGVDIGEATETADRLLVHDVTSPYQSGSTAIRVLLPDQRVEGERFPVLYVLPVEAKDGTYWGDGLREIKKADLHNRHRLICVSPTFSHLPWYADHPTDPPIRQETYFLEVVLPFIEKSYPVRPGRDGRLLLGFSKSGWGAYSLLLRHPDRFARAVAWDAPLAMKRPDKYGMGPIFGNQANFEKYAITALLLRRARFLHGRERLVLLGYGNFREHHRSLHALLEEQRVPHAYRDGPHRKHHWTSGWLEEAVALAAAGELRWTVVIAESSFLIGEAMGRAMQRLLTGQDSAGAPKRKEKK